MITRCLTCTLLLREGRRISLVVFLGSANARRQASAWGVESRDQSSEILSKFAIKGVTSTNQTEPAGGCLSINVR